MLKDVLKTPITQKSGDPKPITDGVLNMEETTDYSNRQGGRKKGQEPRGNQNIDEFDNAVVFDDCDEDNVDETVCGHKRIDRVLEVPLLHIGYDADGQTTKRCNHWAR